MTLWRISNHATLDGAGGLRAPGRWHTRGRRIVYCAPNPATALLEVLVHTELDVEDLPAEFQYLEIEAPDDLASEAAEIAGSARARRIGNDWLQRGSTPLLRVPSVVVPATYNVLINPRHPASAGIRIVRTHRHALDRRLF